jgi:hypothetical protein
MAVQDPNGDGYFAAVPLETEATRQPWRLRPAWFC